MPLRPKPRTLWLAAVLLLGGAAVNVGVAHVCERVQERPRAWASPRPIDADPPLTALAFFGDPFSGPTLQQREKPGWLDAKAAQAWDWVCTERSFSLRIGNSVCCLIHTELRYGLPMRSLRRAEQSQVCVTDWLPNQFQPPGLEGGWPPHWHKRSVGVSMFGPPHPTFAILPMPLGFAVNTLLFASLLALPLLVPAARRRRRLKLGLCPRCAYPLLAAASPLCPECGWRLGGTKDR
ncbi:MAG: hypothetical protein K2Q20_11335 [Phycisphaerales bacterium]|nr:hypothetical protein [Phycisphaerales bacterium]